MKHKKGVIKEIRTNSFTDSGIGVSVQELESIFSSMVISFDRSSFDFEPEVGQLVSFSIQTKILSNDFESFYDNEYEVVAINDDQTWMECSLKNSPYLEKKAGSFFSSEEDPMYKMLRIPEGRSFSVGDKIRTVTISKIHLISDE